MSNHSNLFAEAQPLKTISQLAPILMESDEVVVLDIETTGLSREKHAEILEIGAVKINVPNRKVVDIFSHMICPSECFTLPQKITDITTITWEQVENKPYIEQVLPSLYNFIGDDPIVAHNAQFDWHRFLYPAFLDVGRHATNEVICSMRLAKEVFPGLGRNGYNLAALCERFGTSIEGHHRAYVDCKYTASLYLKLMDILRAQMSNSLAWDSFHESAEVARNPLPSSIPMANTSNLWVGNVSYYQGQSKRLGPSVYVTTNFGTLCYSARRKLWRFTKLKSEYNVPAEMLGKAIFDYFRTDADGFLSNVC